jgi:hypothetical protein
MAGHAEIAGLVPEAVQQLRLQVQGDHVGPREALDQGEGTGTGSAPQVEDPVRIAGQLVDPGDHLGQERVQYLGIEVQEPAQRRWIGLGRGMVVVVFHGATL